MPYVPQSDRSMYKPNCPVPVTAGQLNFQITSLVRQYLDAYGLRYDTVNTIVGALECAKLEVYRRVAAPYEDKKIAENGDVYPS